MTRKFRPIVQSIPQVVALSVESQIGDFETLTTTDKSSIVGAINEVAKSER